MGLTTMKFTITHPTGISVVRFRINYREYDKAKIYTYQTASSPEIKIEGEMELNIVSSKATIEIEAVGTANRLVAFNVEYKGKKILKESEGKVIIDQSTGRGRKMLREISLIPNN